VSRHQAEHEARYISFSDAVRNISGVSHDASSRVNAGRVIGYAIVIAAQIIADAIHDKEVTS